jgi:multidrug efflux pump subunit AcrA (membrane-fusion protein)
MARRTRTTSRKKKSSRGKQSGSNNGPVPAQSEALRKLGNLEQQQQELDARRRELAESAMADLADEYRTKLDDLRSIERRARELAQQTGARIPAALRVGAGGRSGPGGRTGPGGRPVAVGNRPNPGSRSGGRGRGRRAHLTGPYADMTIPEAVEAALREHGPMKPKEVSELIGANSTSLNVAVSKMRKDGQLKPVTPGRRGPLELA